MARDNELGTRLVGKLVETNLVMSIQQQMRSQFTEVVDLSHVTLGSYLKNNIDISELFTDVASFQSMYERVNESAASSTINLMAWSLYIFTSRCFAPGSETPQLMLSVQACVGKLTEVLRLADLFAPDVH